MLSVNRRNGLRIENDGPVEQMKQGPRHRSVDRSVDNTRYVLVSTPVAETARVYWLLGGWEAEIAVSNLYRNHAPQRTSPANGKDHVLVLAAPEEQGQSPVTFRSGVKT